MALSGHDAVKARGRRRRCLQRVHADKSCTLGSWSATFRGRMVYPRCPQLLGRCMQLHLGMGIQGGGDGAARLQSADPELPDLPCLTCTGGL